jgi:phage baseplate assembly protein W
MTAGQRALRYPLAVDASLGQWALERNYAEHVKQLAKQVLLVAPGERVCRPTFGAGLRSMIFAPLRDVTEGLARVTVLQALERWLGDVIAVEDVTVRAGEETLEVGVTYRLRLSAERQYLNLEVTL